MQREELYLQDIVEATEAIERFLKNVEKETFLNDDLLQSAVLYKLTIIGEAAANISVELKNRRAEADWKGIVAFRNIVIHAYFKVDLNIVWETAATRIAPLRELILRILETDFPDFDLRNN